MTKNTRTKKQLGNSYITETKDFAGVIKEENGRKYLKVNAPVFYQHQLNKFKVGDRVSMFISSRKPKRSDAQNRYLWGAYYPLISAETGEPDLDRLHALFVGKFLTTAIVEVLGERVRLVKSSSKLSVSEFSEFIQKIESETGVMSPPTENYDIAQLK